ncbi:TonB-dependent receptor [Croceiramulus getboli]|nr:TonB-dependent receptor plug domain-containing protein [Flavobacteriaceae bacterium YJPT1-3]
MKISTRLIVVLACAGLQTFAWSQQEAETLDEVVLTDSRFALKKENSGKQIITISRETLSRNQGNSLASVINQQSGITINGSQSVAGQPLGTFIRGGNNRQVLVLIDGVALSDPSTIANEFDLRLLDINSIESIEIIKGAASTLYGNSAATAVINITTRKADREAISAQLTAVAGTNEAQSQRNFSWNDFQNHVQLSGTLNKLTYMASFGNQFTDGLSAVEDPMTNEKDRFSRYNSQFKLGYRFSEAFSLTLYGLQDFFKSAYDNSFPIADAPFDSRSEQYRGGLSGGL